MNFKNPFKKISIAVLSGVMALNLPTTAVNAWNDADETEHYNKIIGEVTLKVLDGNTLIRETMGYSAPQPASEPRRISNYLLWGKGGYPHKMKDKGKKIYPYVAGLRLTPMTRFKLTTFAINGLGYLPNSVRRCIVKDFNKVFRKTPANEREKVLDSFMSIALSSKSMIYDIVAKEDYLKFTHEEHLKEHIPDHLAQAEFRRFVDRDLHSVDNYIARYAGILNKHQPAIMHWYRTCGLPINSILERLSLRESATTFDAICEIKPTLRGAAVPPQAFEDIIAKSVQGLDPVLRGEICRDFHNIIIDPSLPGDLARLNRTFAFSRGILAIKRDLYRALEKEFRS